MGKTTKCNLKATLRLRNQVAKRENAAFILLEKLMILHLAWAFVVQLKMSETLGLRVHIARQYELL